MGSPAKGLGGHLFHPQVLTLKTPYISQANKGQEKVSWAQKAILWANPTADFNGLGVDGKAVGRRPGAYYT